MSFDQLFYFGVLLSRQTDFRNVQFSDLRCMPPRIKSNIASAHAVLSSGRWPVSFASATEQRLLAFQHLWMDSSTSCWSWTKPGTVQTVVGSLVLENYVLFLATVIQWFPRIGTLTTDFKCINFAHSISADQSTPGWTSTEEQLRASIRRVGTAIRTGTERKRPIHLRSADRSALQLNVLGTFFSFENIIHRKYYSFLSLRRCWQLR